MRQDWKAATEYIKDLETINDLQSAEIEELRSMLAAARGQITQMKMDRDQVDLKVIG